MRKTSAVVGLLLLVGTLGACSSSDNGNSSGGDYCSVLKDSKDSFAGLGFDQLTDEKFASSRESIDKLQQAASGAIADDWATLGTSLDELQKAVKDAGLSMADIPKLITGKVPAGLDPTQAQQLVGELQKVGSNPDLSAAVNEIASDAKQTCQVDLQGTPST